MPERGSFHMIPRRPPGTDDLQAVNRFLTVQQLAEIWQLSKRTIYRMIDNGELPARKFGRAVRIDPEVAMRLGRSSSAERSNPTKE
jgi:excisionase family DNA binding protein